MSNIPVRKSLENILTEEAGEGLDAEQPCEMYDFADELSSSSSSRSLSVNGNARNAFKSKHCEEAKLLLQYNETLKFNIEEIFLGFIDPASFVHIFKKYSKHVLTPLDIENVVSKQRNENKQSAARELLNILGRYDKWFPTFIKCLKDKNVKLGHLVDILTGIEAEVRAYTYGSATNKKTSKGASNSICGSDTSSWKNFFLSKRKKEISREFTEDRSDSSSSTDFVYTTGLPTLHHHRPKLKDDLCPCQLKSILKDLKIMLDATQIKSYDEISEKLDLLLNIIKTYRNCYKLMFQVQNHIHGLYTKVSLLDISVARNKTLVLTIKQYAVDIVLLCVNSSHNVSETLLTKDFIGIIVNDLKRLKFAKFSKIDIDEDSKTFMANLKRDMALLLLTIVRNKTYTQERFGPQNWTEDLLATDISNDCDKFVSDMSLLLKCYICEEMQFITFLKEKRKDPEIVLNDLLAHLRIYATYETPSIQIQMKVQAYVEGFAALAIMEAFFPMIKAEQFLSNVHTIISCFDDQSIYRAYVHLLTNATFPQMQEMTATSDPESHTENDSSYKTVTVAKESDAISQFIKSDILNCNDEKSSKSIEHCVQSKDSESIEYFDPYLIPADNYDYFTKCSTMIGSANDQTDIGICYNDQNTCSQSTESDSDSPEGLKPDDSWVYGSDDICTVDGDDTNGQTVIHEYSNSRTDGMSFEESCHHIPDAYGFVDNDKEYNYPSYLSFQIDSGILSTISNSSRAPITDHEEMSQTLPVLPPKNITSLQSTLVEIPGDAIDLKEIIGIGRTGKVYRGVMHKNTEVAVKKCEASMMAEQSTLKEANIMKKLKHTNIVELLGIVTAGGSCSIIMEYMRRGNLKSFLKSAMGKSSKLYDINGINLQIAQGMKYLHGMGIVHRDLRAVNIVVGDHFVVKISDFDLARDLWSEDSIYIAHKESKFPIRWSPPEAIFERKFSFKSDVWSFAVVMFETITLGETPYYGLSNKEVMNLTSQGALMGKPTNGPIDVPDSYFNLMLECWNKIPERRPDFARLQIYFENERKT